jgi:hypothetical protein
MWFSLRNTRISWSSNWQACRQLKRGASCGPHEVQFQGASHGARLQHFLQLNFLSHLHFKFLKSIILKYTMFGFFCLNAVGLSVTQHYGRTIVQISPGVGWSIRRPPITSIRRPPSPRILLFKKVIETRTVPLVNVLFIWHFIIFFQQMNKCINNICFLKHKQIF